MVSAMAPKTRGPLEAFDDAKLAELTEPITVTVHKVLNGRPCPIVLPPKPEWDVPGKGWSQDEVRQLENFIVTAWSGGGQYHFAATGDNGQQIRWQAYWPVDKYPEKGPLVSAPPSSNGNGASAPTLAGAASTVVVPPTPAYMPPPTWMQYSAAHLAAASPTASTPATQAPTYYQYPTPLSRHSDASDRLQEEREARLQLEAKIERERLENHYKEQLAMINQEMRRLQEQMQIRPTGESPETLALKAQLEALQRERENDRAREMQRETQRESERQIAALQQSTQQQIAALTTLIQQLQQKPVGPDPFMMMMIESQKAQATAQLEIAKLQAEAQKEAARLQAESAREAARTSIGPRELIDIMSRAGQGQEQLANGYTRLIEATQQTFENMLNAQGPQVHPALEMLGQGVQGALGVAQRYIEAKENAATNQARAAAAVGQAQAQAQVAAAQLAAAAGGGVPTGAVVGAGQPDEVGDDDDEGGEGDDEIDAMEQELFGGALEQVKKLRNAVASGQAPPDRIASAILDGIAYFGNKGEAVKAFDLWRTGELAKLIDVLIPDATTSYRGQVAEALFKVRQQANK